MSDPESETEKPKLILKEAVPEQKKVQQLETVRALLEAIMDDLPTDNDISRFHRRIRVHLLQIDKLLGTEEAHQIRMFHSIMGSTPPDDWKYWDVEGELNVYQFAKKLHEDVVERSRLD